MNLFDMTPEALLQQRAAALDAASQNYAKQDAQSRADAAGYQFGNIAARGLGSAMGVEDKELLKVRDIQGMMKGIDRNDPEQLLALSKALGTKGYMAEGEMAWQKAQEMKKVAAELAAKGATAAKDTSIAQKNKDESAAAVAKAESRKKALKALKVPEDQIEGIASSDTAFTDYVKQAGTKVVTANGRELLINERTGATIKDLGAAPDRGTRITNVMGGGTAKLSDILPTLTAVRAEQGATKDSITQSSQALRMLELNNPKADAQVDRALATLSGDKQLSQSEVTSVATAGSFPQRVVDNVSKFFTGQAATLSTEEKKELLQLLNKAATASYNKNKARLKTVLSSSELSKEQVDGILGDDVTEYVPKGTPKASKADGDGYRTTKSGVKYKVE
jgi:hypothetical protein